MFLLKRPLLVILLFSLVLIKVVFAEEQGANLINPASSPQNLTTVAKDQPGLLANSPQGVEIKPGGEKIVLAWEAFSNTPAAKIIYQIFRSENPLSLPPPAGISWPAPINPAPIQEEYYLDTAGVSRIAPQMNRHYYYALIAVDAKGNSSLPAFIDVINIAELSSPINVQGVGGDQTVKLTWTAAFSGGMNGLAGYRVFRSQQAGVPGDPLFTEPLKTTEYSDRASPAHEVENGKEYFFTVFSQDQAGNQSQAPEQILVIPFKPAGMPENVTATGKTDDMIELTWSASKPGTFPLAGYNIYRRTEKEKWHGPINKKIVTAVNYVDSDANSISKPILGKNYYYSIRPMDEKGLEGLESSVVQAAPQLPLEIPNTGLLSTAIPGLPPESSLTISGRKKIDIGYTQVTPLNTGKDGPQERYPSLTSGLTKGFNLTQELQVRLEGKVGKKITVDVDYDDTKEEQRKISIIYTGDPEEIIQEAAFGDILLDLPHTEFAGYNKNLFGAKLKVAFNGFRLTAIGAQTKGISVTEKFKGNTSPRQLEIQDVDFITYKYYYLTKDWPNQVNHPDLPLGYDSNQPARGIVAGSVQIYITDGMLNADTVTVTANTRYLRFNRQSPGIDYTVDFERGIVNFLKNIDRNWTIVVAYRYYGADNQIHSIGYLPNSTVDFSPDTLNLPDQGRTSDTAHLIQDSYNIPGAFRMMLMNRYSMGYQNIFDPQNDPDFSIKIFTSGGQEIPIAQPRDQKNSENFYKIDPIFGTVQFKHDYPLGKAGPLFFQDTYDYNNPDNDSYNVQLNSRLGGIASGNANNYRIRIEFKNLITTFQLGHFNILKNSEVIKKDGLKLQRNTDYYIDYDTGFITFLNPASIAASSDISITYEYLPFGGKFQTNLFGARGEYDIFPKNLTLGSTFLYNASQTPLDIPDVRTTPTSLMIFDGDAKLTLNPDDFGLMTLPWLGSFKIPLSLQVSAEAAMSQYETNTYRKSGEGGVALIDGMEGSDNILSLPTDNNSWFPGSAPVQFTDLASRRFSKLASIFDFGRVRIYNNDNDKKNMLYWECQNLGINNWDGFVYPVAASGTNLHDYRFLEISADVNQEIVLYVDVGIVGEDSNGNGRLNFEGDRTHLGTGEDIGTENYIKYFDQNNQAVIDKDPSGGPWGSYPGHAADYPDYQPNYDNPANSDYLKNVRSYWGGGNNRLNNEDLDNNDNLDTAESFYEYKIVLTPGFKLYKIPLTVIDNLQGFVLGSMPPTRDSQNLQFLSIVKHVRLWVQGSPATTGANWIKLESVQFTGNKWQVRVAPNTVWNGVAILQPSANTLNATTISKETDPDYYPNPFFFNYDTTKADQELMNEKAIKVEYRLDKNAVVSISNTSPAYYLTRTLSSGTAYDYANYRYLRLDVFRKVKIYPREQLFIRLSQDENNYFEYRVNMDEAPVGAWHTFVIELQGDDRYAHFGTHIVPSLSQVREITMGIFNPNDPIPGETNSEVLWINNLRVTDSFSRKGVAYLVNSKTNLSDIATVNTDIRDLGSDFFTIDESPNGKQHQTQSSVNGSITKIPFLPISANWSRRSTFTELQFRDNPAYSYNYSLPDVTTEILSGELRYNQIPGLNVSLFSSNTQKVTEYIKQWTNVNNLEHTASANSEISYSVPDHILTVPVGNSTLTGKVGYTDDHTMYDPLGASNNSRSDLWDRWKHTVDESYAYQGNYRPFSFINLSPNFTYAQTRDRGYLSWYRYYADLNPLLSNNQKYFVEDYKVSRVNKVAGFTLGFLGLPVISPTASYTMTQTRDYVNDSLNVPGSLNLQTSIVLGDLIGWRQCPQFNFSENYTVSANYQNERELDYISDLDFKTLWVIDPLTFKKSNDEFDQAYINSKSLTDTLSSQIVLLPDVTLSPQYSSAWNRRMNSRGNFTTTDTLSLGSGLMWNNITSWQGMALQSLNLDYRFSQNRSFDTVGVENSRNLTHDTNLTLPFKLSSEINGSLNSGMNNVIRLSGQNLNIKYYENQYSGGITLNYRFHMTEPIRLPNFWPFSGALIRIEQTLLLTDAFNLSVVRNTEENTAGTTKSTDTYTNDTTINYSLWKNVDGNLKLTNQWFYDRIVANKDYWAISLKLGLTAIF